MPNNETSHRKQDAVLWAFSGHDRHGQVMVSSPVALKVRSEKSQREMLDANMSAVATDFTMVVDREITEGSVIWLGKLADVPDDTTTLTDLKVVTIYTETPDIKNRHVRREIRLMKYSDSLPSVS